MPKNKRGQFRHFLGLKIWSDAKGWFPKGGVLADVGNRGKGRSAAWDLTLAKGKSTWRMYLYPDKGGEGTFAETTLLQNCTLSGTKNQPNVFLHKFFQVRDVPTQIPGHPGHSLSNGPLAQSFCPGYHDVWVPDVPGISCPKTLSLGCFLFLTLVTLENWHLIKENAWYKRALLRTPLRYPPLFGFAWASASQKRGAL